MEYRALIMEYASDKEERAFLAQHGSNGSSSGSGSGSGGSGSVYYGKITYFYCLRDLDGVGLQHLGGEGEDRTALLSLLSTLHNPYCSINAAHQSFPVYLSNLTHTLRNNNDNDRRGRGKGRHRRRQQELPRLPR